MRLPKLPKNNHSSLVGDSIQESENGNVEKPAHGWRTFFGKLLFVLTGIGATIWFLSRVITKPSRAYYPCMQATAPVMASFIVYLISLTGSVMIFKRFHNSLVNRKYFLAGFLAMVFMVVAGIAVFTSHEPARAQVFATGEFTPNQPIGEAKGINPGRVVWVWDKDVTRQGCQQTTNNNGTLDNGDDLWFMDKNTDQNITDFMLSKSIQELTGQPTDQQSWEALFTHFNQEKGKGEISYQPGEIIFLKTNHGSAWGNDRFHSDLRFKDNSWNAGYTETGPQLVLSLLRHLVNVVGVPEQNIYVGDPMKNIYKEYYTKWHNEFPNVKYLGNNLLIGSPPNIVALGRTPVIRTGDNVLVYSDNGTAITENKPNKHKLYTIFQDADYLINVAALKPHEVGGITLSAKNHFGSHASNDAMHLHNALVKDRPDYGIYRVLVDLMGHPLLGRNTMLFVVDNMWSGKDMELERPVKWAMEPFSNDYPSSLLVSQDMVAIESVGHDFLRTEYTVGNYEQNNPNLAGVDDYMRQAADSEYWPEGIQYKPDGQNVIPSLGVHEHWNNPSDMQYTRNLGTGNGIELIKMWIDGNRAPLAIKPLPPFQSTFINVSQTAVADLNQYFWDADNANLEYTATSNHSKVTPIITGNSVDISLSSVLAQDEEAVVTVTASDGSNDISLSFTVTSSPETSVSNRVNDPTIKIFPNPVDDFVTVELTKPGDYTIRIFDTSHRILRDIQTTSRSVRIDMSELASGNYFVQVLLDKQQVNTIQVLKK